MKKGFTLTEILVSLFVIMIITILSIPVFTQALTKQRTGDNRPWKWVNNSAFFNSTINSALIIGSNSAPAENTTKFLINTNTNNTDHIAFWNSDTKVGKLNANNDGYFFGYIGNNIGNDQTSGNAICIGNNLICNSNSVIIGNQIYGHNNAVVLGINTGCTGDNAVAIGTSVRSNNNSIAIGTGAIANSLNACAIGHSVIVNNEANYSFVLGDNSVSNGVGTIVIGINSNVEAANSIVIGHETNISASQTFYYTPTSYRYYTDSVVLGNPNMNIVLLKDTYVPQSLKVYNVVVTTASAASPNSLSDLKLKNIQSEYTSGIDKLNRIKVYNYTLKSNPKDRIVGVIAQELIKIFPDAVSKDNRGYYLIRHEDIFYAMINSLKEFDKKLKAIAEDISNLNKLTVSLDAKIKKLEKQTVKNTNDLEKLKKEINIIEGVKDKQK